MVPFLDYLMCNPAILLETDISHSQNPFDKSNDSNHWSPSKIGTSSSYYNGQFGQKWLGLF